METANVSEKSLMYRGALRRRSVIGSMNMEPDEPRDPLGQSLQSLRFMQSVFSVDESNTSNTNKRQSPGSADNSLSGSITEQLHFEAIAPSERVESDMVNIQKVDVSQLGTGTIRDEILFAEEVPQVVIHVDSTQSEPSDSTECKRCQRGPSYHHGHHKDCPRSHFAKRQKRESSLLSPNVSAITCKRCIIGPSYHKAHARNCPRSKYFQQTLWERDTRGRKKKHADAEA